jgi:hypothetical protein
MGRMMDALSRTTDGSNPILLISLEIGSAVSSDLTQSRGVVPSIDQMTKLRVSDRVSERMR